MTHADLLELIVWIFMAFWAILYVDVQLERLNQNIFVQQKDWVLKRLEESAGALRVIGLVLYSPYVMPVRAAIAWFVIVIVMFVF